VHQRASVAHVLNAGHVPRLPGANHHGQAPRAYGHGWAASRRASTTSQVTTRTGFSASTLGGAL